MRRKMLRSAPPRPTWKASCRCAKRAVFGRGCWNGTTGRAIPRLSGCRMPSSMATILSCRLRRYNSTTTTGSSFGAFPVSMRAAAADWAAKAPTGSRRRPWCERWRTMRCAWPDLSLGVVAFSKAQADMLTEVLELERRRDPVLDGFLREGRHEDVFVKNIENVQGDERDVILISVGYGPQEPNGRLASMSFGPVNGEGGERRLNVLFSRARVRCEVFASFDPGDIDPGRSKREGPRVLKRFLDFAKTGVMEERVSYWSRRRQPVRGRRGRRDPLPRLSGRSSGWDRRVQDRSRRAPSRPPRPVSGGGGVRRGSVSRGALGA